MIHSPLNDLFAKTVRLISPPSPPTASHVQAAADPTLAVPDFSPLYWDTPDGQHCSNISWYSPGQKLQRGGVTGQYSERNYSPTKFATVFPKHLFKQVRFLSLVQCPSPDKILLVSDGLCGSTCAVFSSHLDEVDHVNSVSLGGVYPNPQAFFSFPGGKSFLHKAVFHIPRSGRLNAVYRRNRELHWCVV